MSIYFNLNREEWEQNMGDIVELMSDRAFLHVFFLESTWFTG